MGCQLPPLVITNYRVPAPSLLKNTNTYFLKRKCNPIRLLLFKLNIRLFSASNLDVLSHLDTSLIALCSSNVVLLHLGLASQIPYIELRRRKAWYLPARVPFWKKNIHKLNFTYISSYDILCPHILTDLHSHVQTIWM